MIADKFAQTREVLISDWPFDLTATAEVPFHKSRVCGKPAEYRGDDNMPRHRCWPRSLAAMMCGVPLVSGVPSAAQAEDDSALAAKSRNSGFPELDSKYLFGNFTRGASVGDEGERAIEPDTVANFAKRSGQYAATLTELELEYSPTRFLQLELGPTISYYNIRGVPGLNDLDALHLVGVAAVEQDLGFTSSHGFLPAACLACHSASDCGKPAVHSKKLMGVLWRREILALAMKGNRALHDLAMVRRLELQTNFAALPPAVRTGLKRRGLQEFQEFSA